jgi:hypothetical protein
MFKIFEFNKGSFREKEIENVLNNWVKNYKPVPIVKYISHTENENYITLFIYFSLNNL